MCVLKTPIINSIYFCKVTTFLLIDQKLCKLFLENHNYYSISKKHENNLTLIISIIVHHLNVNFARVHCNSLF